SGGRPDTTGMRSTRTTAGSIARRVEVSSDAAWPSWPSRPAARRTGSRKAYGPTTRTVGLGSASTTGRTASRRASSWTGSVGPVGLDGPEGQEEPRPRGDGRRELVLREVGEPDGGARAHEAPSAGPAAARPAASATNVRLVGSRRITAVPGARR